MYISEEQASNIIRAVEHYAAYLKATNRDDRQYRELAESLKRKPPVPQRQVRVSKQQVERKRTAAKEDNAVNGCVDARRAHRGPAGANA